MAKNKIQCFFNRAAESYDNNCQLQIETGKRLLALTKLHCDVSLRIIDVGCGTGIITELIANHFSFREFHAIDLANALLTKAAIRLKDFNIKLYENDFDYLSHKNGNFDLMFANMSLHWSKNIFSTFSHLKKSLNKLGLLVFSLPLSGSLPEIKDIYSCQTFCAASTLSDYLYANNYDILYHEQQTICLPFANTVSALKSIKQIGANYVATRKNCLRGKDFLRKVQLQQLTYEIGYFVVRNNENDS